SRPALVPPPVAIRLKRDKYNLELEWPDGSKFLLSSYFLRSHRSVIRRLPSRHSPSFQSICRKYWTWYFDKACPRFQEANQGGCEDLRNSSYRQLRHSVSTLSASLCFIFHIFHYIYFIL